MTNSASIKDSYQVWDSHQVWDSYQGMPLGMPKIAPCHCAFRRCIRLFVSNTLQLEKPIDLNDAPKLLVEWSPRWQEFTTSIGPAFSRSCAPTPRPICSPTKSSTTPATNFPASKISAEPNPAQPPVPAATKPITAP